MKPEKKRGWFVHEPAEWAADLEICTTPEKCRRIKGQSVLLVREIEKLTFIEKAAKRPNPALQGLGEAMEKIHRSKCGCGPFKSAKQGEEKK